MRKRYRGVLLARPELDLASLEDFQAVTASLRLAAVLPGSTSGGLVQLAALAGSDNVGLQFQSLLYAGSHEAALAALVDGEADIAAIAEVPWHAWQEAHPDLRHPRQVWQSEPLPTGPLVCRRSIRLNCAMLADFLISNNEVSQNAAVAVATGWPELGGARRFVPYVHQGYEGLIGALLPEG